MTISFDLGKTNLSSNTEFMSKTKTLEVIPVLVILGVFLIPCWEGVVGVKNFFSAKNAQPQYLPVGTKFVSNEQRFWKLYQF